MSRRSLTLAIACVSLIAGACAGKIQTVVHSEPTKPVAEAIEPALLPVRALTFDTLAMPALSLTEASGVASSSEPDRCRIETRIEDARVALEPLELTVGTREYRYTERRAGGVVTFKDPEKTIGLALLDPRTCELSTTLITKRGDALIAHSGFAIEPVIRANGIRWNNWATQFKVTKPANRIIVALKYPYVRTDRVARTVTNSAGKRVTVYDSVKKIVPIYYTPYSDELHIPELVRDGERHLIDLAERAYENLRSRGVLSLAKPGTLVADVAALQPEFVIRLAPIEHMDISEFLLDPTWTTERIHIIIGANRERVATYTCSRARACGLMQFTSGTYAMMRKLYPAAGLIASFEDGARDQLNAMKAAVLLHDYNTSQLISAFGPEVLEDPRLEEYLAAAYNTGVGRVIAVLAVAKKKNVADWTQARGTQKIERLLDETKGYIAKLRYLRDEWRPGLIALQTL